MRYFPAANLQRLCTYRIGGSAEVFEPETIEEFVEMVMHFRRKARPFWVLGGGANTLFGDGYLPFPLISTRGLQYWNIYGTEVMAEAGVWLDRLVAATVRRGLGGLENLSGIPGSVGGALVMNAGAYGAAVSDALQSVTVLTQDGAVLALSHADCGFAYRTASGLTEAIVLAARWRLTPGDPAALHEQRRQILTRRKRSQPLEFPSAGSVFKRPPGDFASRLVDAAGLKGVAVGGAQISPKHAGFIVNIGGATCAHVLELIEICRATVAQCFGVHLELEQRLCLGQDTLPPQYGFPGFTPGDQGTIGIP